jgi:hypothetical protein
MRSPMTADADASCVGVVRLTDGTPLEDIRVEGADRNFDGGTPHQWRHTVAIRR